MLSLGGKIRRSAVALSTAFALSVGSALVASPAQAAPWNCPISGSGNGRSTLCYNGGGQYQVSPFSVSHGQHWVGISTGHGSARATCDPRPPGVAGGSTSEQHGRRLARVMRSTAPLERKESGLLIPEIFRSSGAGFQYVAAFISFIAKFVVIVQVLAKII